MISVLIVSSHGLLAECLREALGAVADIGVTGIAATGDEAVARAVSTEPDVVVTDYGLPDLTGAELIQQLRSECPSVKAIVLAATLDDRAMLESIEAGCSGVLGLESIGLADLVAAIRAAATGEATISPGMLSRLLNQLSKRGDERRPLLSRRELDILHRLAAGESTRSIAATMHLSIHTVRNHVQSIIGKLGAHSKLEAVARASGLGLVAYPAESAGR